MLDSKPQPTPMVSSFRLVVDASVAVADPTLYRSVVGALQYIHLLAPNSPSLSTEFSNSCTTHNSHTALRLNVFFGILQTIQLKVYVCILLQTTRLLPSVTQIGPLILMTANLSQSIAFMFFPVLEETEGCLP